MNNQIDQYCSPDSAKEVRGIEEGGCLGCLVISLLCTECKREGNYYVNSDTVSISSDLNERLFGGTPTVEDIELWTARMNMTRDCLINQTP